MSTTTKEYFSNYKNFSSEEREYAISLLHKLHGFALVSDEEMEFYHNLLLNKKEMAA